jgi:phosphoglycerate dehydrogenase-like enzyme
LITNIPTSSISGSSSKDANASGTLANQAKVTAVGNAFGMRVLAWSTNLTAEAAAEHGATRVEKDELLRRADIATIHLKLGDRTHGLIGARELELLGPDGYLVNTSRGPIVDEAALLAALRSGTIAGAGLDVYGTEPLPEGHPLRTAPNTVLTPHVGYGTHATYEVFFRETVEDVVSFLEGTPVRVLN